MALFAVLLGAALGLSTEAISSSDIADAIGYSVGSAMVLLLVPYVVLFFARSETAWKTLIVICAIVALGQWSNYATTEDSAENRATLELAETSREAIAEQRRLLEKYSPDGSSDQIKTATSDSKPAVSPTKLALDENGPRDAVVIQKINRLIREQSAENSAASQVIGDAILALRLEETLDPRELTTADGIERSRTRLSKYATLTDDSERLSMASASKIEREFRAITRGARNESSLMAGFKKARLKRSEIDRLTIANQRALIATATRVVGFMAARLGETSHEGEQVLFSSDEDAKTYNDMVKELSTLTEEETVLSNRLQALLGQNLRDVEQLTAK